MSRLLRVEGWRWVPHSYAMVNQYQCLNLARRAGLRLRHCDLPPLGNWARSTGLLSPDQEAVLAAIPAPQPADGRPDAVLRIQFPYDFTPSDSPRTLVFGTAEHRWVPPRFVAGGMPLATAMANSEVIALTPSNWSRTGFLDTGADPSRVFVVPHGVDETVFHPAAPEVRAAARARLNLDGVVFLAVGSMTANKGMATLLKAFAVVVQRHPEARLLIKGTDALYHSGDRLRLLVADDALLTEREKAAVLSRLAYIGETLSSTDMATVYRVADAFVSPYRGEAFNMPALEAAACGLPLICTRGGPTDDYTTEDFALPIDSTTAPAPLQLCPDGGVELVPRLEHLIELMTSVIVDPQIIERARRAAPAHVRGNHTWNHAVDRLLSVIFPGERFPMADAGGSNG